MQNKKEQNNILRFGEIQLTYESGSVRYISLGGIEIIRMIYSAVRDEYWETVEPEISNEVINSESDTFTIQYNCRYKKGAIDFDAKYILKGTSEGLFTFEMYGKANSDFYKNRIGFCVLHPINEYVGKKVIIGHPDGSSSENVFPLRISPHQPFMNIQSMKAFFSLN